ncbi:MAG: hypothetical protein KAU62_05430, partial [Candidatus Heimdallarchaeota archaeon]|nr:hypothetical protein [Candidatus Heimdallarchaeota archaeon]
LWKKISIQLAGMENNQKAGMIILGISDDLEIKGVRKTKLEELRDAIQKHLDEKCRKNKSFSWYWSFKLISANNPSCHIHLY